jgi:hypothetical protein
MLDFDVDRCSRRCAATEREFQPGDEVVSALTTEQGQVRRSDYLASAWPGPSDATLAWWKSRVPASHDQKQRWAPSEVMLECFEQLAGVSDKQELRYLLALVLVRKRILRQEAIEKDEAGREIVVLYCPRTESEHRVLQAFPAAESAAQVQAELLQLLQQPVLPGAGP